MQALEFKKSVVEKPARFILLCFLMTLFVFPSYGADNDNAAKSEAELQMPEKQKADLAVTKSRAQYRHNLDDLLLFFSDYHLPSASCFNAALSNYVEDSWNRIGKETGCDSDAVSCRGSNPNSFLEMLAEEKRKDPETLRSAIVFGNTWALAAALYNFMRPIYKYLVPANGINSFSANYVPDISIDKKAPPADVLKAQIDELHKYMDSCASLKPVAWSVVGNNIPSPQNSPNLSRAAIKLGVYNLLVEYVIGGKIPESKQGYIGCLVTLNQFKEGLDKCGVDKKCIETISVETKDNLSRQLEELKAHQCEITYTANFAKRLQSAPETPAPNHQ